MLPDKVKYYIAATTAQDIDTVFDTAQPDLGATNNCITVFAENEVLNPHTDTVKASYQAIVRNTSQSTGETLARTIADAVRVQNGLSVYYGIKLTAAMGADEDDDDPITFAPDDGSGVTKAGQFTAGDYILIGDEILLVTGVTSPNVTATRAALGTTIAAHLDNDPVYNISHDPIPTKQNGSIVADGGVLTMGPDSKYRYEYAVNWTVRLR